MIPKENGRHNQMAYVMQFRQCRLIARIKAASLKETAQYSEVI
jgi:hypothetical protein